jgi:putative peptide zinc metalloprotease protein
VAHEHDDTWTEPDELPVQLVRAPVARDPESGRHVPPATFEPPSEPAMPIPSGTDSPSPDDPTPLSAPPPPRAAEFSDEYMLRRRNEKPGAGWRRVVYELSGGLVNVGPSRAELLERELIARVKTPVRGCRRIAVISRKGGVGKTTTTLCLGHTFASHRGDRVVALDGNPDAGSLGYRVRRETTATVTDLLRETDGIDRYSDVRAFTSQAPTRLEVVASDDDPRISQALQEDDYKRVSELLEHHYNLILLDTGTGILDSATRGILDLADQLVVVMAPSLDGARAASLTLDWLDEHAYGELVLGAIAVINAVRSNDSLIELGRVEEHFALRCRGVVRIPWDPHLEAGAETRPEDLRPTSRNAYLQLAASVAEGFPTRPSSIAHR